MRRTTIAVLSACLLLVGAAVGCSKSYDEKAEDCTTALTERTEGKPGDSPTVSEAEERVDALDETLTDMVRMGHQGAAKDAADAVEKETKEGGKSRPDPCKPLSKGDYTTLIMAKAIGGLGWTDMDGQFDKLKMAESLRD